jgi:hypothetical protein
MSACIFRVATDSLPVVLLLLPATDHLKVVEDQAMAMLAQNERLEKRMMALEQHVQVGGDSYVLYCIIKGFNYIIYQLYYISIILYFNYIILEARDGAGAACAGGGIEVYCC